MKAPPPGGEDRHTSSPTGLLVAQLEKGTSTPGPFSAYLRQALFGGCRSSPHCTTPSEALLPCPPPFAPLAGNTRTVFRSRRRTTRLREWENRRRHINLIVGALSYHAAGAPRFCNPQWRFGRPLNARQEDMVAHLHTALRSAGRLLSSCGRTIARLDNTYQALAGQVLK